MTRSLWCHDDVNSFPWKQVIGWNVENPAVVTPEILARRRERPMPFATTVARTRTFSLLKWCTCVESTITASIYLLSYSTRRHLFVVVSTMVVTTTLLARQLRVAATSRSLSTRITRRRTLLSSCYNAPASMSSRFFSSAEPESRQESEPVVAQTVTTAAPFVGREDFKKEEQKRRKLSDVS